MTRDFIRDLMASSLGLATAFALAAQPAEASVGANGGVKIENVTTGKTGDGNWTVCVRASQANRQSWKLKSFSAVPAAAGQVAMKIEAERLHCGKDADGKYAWLSGRATAAEDWIDPLDGSHYTKWIENLEFLAIANSRLFAQAKADSDTVTLEPSVRAEELVEKSDLAAYNAGQKVPVRIAIFPRGFVFYKLNGGQTNALGLRALGSYTAMFWISKSDASFEEEGK